MGAIKLPGRKKTFGLSGRVTYLRFLNFIVLFALVGTLLLHFTLAASAGWHYPDESDQVNRINSHRNGLRLNVLNFSGCLTNAARDHARTMSSAPRIYHSDLASIVTRHCGNWGYRIGENVGRGSTVSSIWNAYLASPCHRANIESASFSTDAYGNCSGVTSGPGAAPWTHVGVGSWRSADGRIDTVQIFVYAPDTGYGNFNQVVNTNPVPAYSTGSEPHAVLLNGSGPSVASMRPGHLDVFARGGDNALWHRSWNGSSWGAWEKLGGILASSPTAVSWADGRMDVFAKGQDGALWHIYFNGGWSGWESLGGQLSSAPSVASMRSGHLDVFARGTDNALWHRSYNNNWGGWEKLGGGLSSSPAAVSWADGRIDVFARGNDNALWQIFYANGRWNSWGSLGGILSSSPSVSSWKTGRLDVFARGNDNALWHRAYEGSWYGWESLGGVLTSAPGTVSWSDNRIDVFARGNDGALYQKAWQPGWSPWYSLGGYISEAKDF